MRELSGLSLDGNRQQKDSKKIVLILEPKTTRNLYKSSLRNSKNAYTELYELNGIELVETEESYTSQASFLDDDFVAQIVEKPDIWKPSGKRIETGFI